MIEKLSEFDWPITEDVPDGYYMKSVPKPSTKNLMFLFNKINEIIDLINPKEDEIEE